MLCSDCTHCRIKLKVVKGKIRDINVGDSCTCRKGLWARHGGQMVDSVIYKSVMNSKFRYNPNPFCPDYDGEAKSE